MYITVYTCIKNEASNLERWADTAQDADALVLVDTGSDDDSVRIAEQLGLDVTSVHIDPFRFDDARNAALWATPKESDLCLQLDADETLRAGWRDQIESNPGHARYTYWLEPGSPDASWGEVKRSNLHARSGFRWKHAVHEALQGEEPSCHLDGLVVEHHPDNTKDRAYQLDLMRYWSIMDDDPRLLHYLGRDLIYRGLWVEARAVLWKHVQQSSFAAEKSESFHLLSAIDSDPERWLVQATKTCPERREPWVRYARWLLDNGRPKEAFTMIRAGQDRTERGLFTTDPSCWGAKFLALKADIIKECAIG